MGFSVGGDTALSVSNLSSLPGSAPAELNGVNFRVASGQIYGIAGVGGNGQTELADVLMGVRSDVSGEVTLAGNADLLAMMHGQLQTKNWLTRGLRKKHDRPKQPKG